MFGSLSKSFRNGVRSIAICWKLLFSSENTFSFDLIMSIADTTLWLLWKASMLNLLYNTVTPQNKESVSSFACIINRKLPGYP